MTKPHLKPGRPSEARIARVRDRLPGSPFWELSDAECGQTPATPSLSLGRSRCSLDLGHEAWHLSNDGQTWPPDANHDCAVCASGCHPSDCPFAGMPSGQGT